MTRDEAKVSVGLYGRARGPKGRGWYGRVIDVDQTCGYVKVHHGGRMADRWYSIRDVDLNPGQIAKATP